MVTAGLRERFERDGFIFPIRVFSSEQAAGYAAAYERCERDGQIKDDSPGLKIHCVFPWAYEIATNPAVLDVVERLIGPNILVFGSRPWNKLPHDRRYVAWHQDNSYYGLDPHDEVALWVAHHREHASRTAACATCPEATAGATRSTRSSATR